MMIALLFAVSLSCLFFGLFLCFKPTLAIEIQKKFYAKINWRIEPINLQKEIRNTKLMGLFLIIFVAATLIYFVFSKT